MNEYERQLAALQCHRCEQCAGSGQCNNAEAGDIYFQTWECTNCGTTGLESNSMLVERRLKEKDLYPCRECGMLRTKAEGGTTFTVCDTCWDKLRPKNEKLADKLSDIITGNNTKMCDKCYGFHKGMTCEQYKAVQQFYNGDLHT